MAKDEWIRMLPGFWDGPTGIALLERGGPDAQRVAIWLVSNRRASNLGLYTLRLTVMQAELGLSREAALDALGACSREDFAHYDAETMTVWIPKMAHYQFWLDRQPLSPDDKRVKGVQRRAAALPRSPFVVAFWEAYGAAFHLGEPPEPEPPPSPSEGPSKGLRRGLQAPSLQGSGTETGTRTETPTAQTRASARGRGWDLDPGAGTGPEQSGPEQSADVEAASDDRRAPRPADELDRGPEAIESAAGYLAYLAEACRHRGRDELVKAVRGLDPVGRYATGPRNHVYAGSRRVRGVLKAAADDGVIPDLVIRAKRDRRVG